MTSCGVWRDVLHSERPGHTLRATALVHEAYLRLMDADIGWQDRAHFYAIAARIVRRILVEYARERGRQKRGGGEQQVTLDEAVLVVPRLPPPCSIWTKPCNGCRL